MRDLTDMIVLITGASAGIGAALARSLHARGARLVLTARRADRLEVLNRELGGNHLVVAGDVGKTEDCRRMVDSAMNRFSRLDTVVANAGFGMYDLVHETSPQDVRDIFQTNVFGTTDLIHAAVPHLLKNDVRDGWRGQVMIVSSVAGRRGVPYLGVYSGTKAAQHAIAEAMRVELAPAKVAVTGVYPIMTKTEFGKVAETRGHIVLPRSSSDGMTQTVEYVAQRMVRVIQRPRAELWPSAPTRLAVSIGWLLPRIADLGLSRYRDEVAAKNPR
jgi:short-subunit dehydrogenase